MFGAATAGDDVDTTFFTAVACGSARLEDFLLWINAWHEEPTLQAVPLHVYLGLTWNEYGAWVGVRNASLLDIAYNHGIVLSPWQRLRFRLSVRFGR